MRLLLDTHVALWWIKYDPRLREAERRLIEDGGNFVAVSVVTVWEIAIKFARPNGRPDDMPLSGTEAIAEFVRAGLDLLPVDARHAAAVDDLPPLHGDPFDRMLVAQATIDGLRLMTHDRRLKRYGAMVLAV